MRLGELGPLKLVVPSQANTRRRLIETYLASNGVRLERLLELDAMLGTLDFVARTDWVAILPALMMGIETRPRLFCVNPIVSPRLQPRPRPDRALPPPHGARRPSLPADARRREPPHQPPVGKAGRVRVAEPYITAQ